MRWHALQNPIAGSAASMHFFGQEVAIPGHLQLVNGCCFIDVERIENRSHHRLCCLPMKTNRLSTTFLPTGRFVSHRKLMLAVVPAQTHQRPNTSKAKLCGLSLCREKPLLPFWWRRKLPFLAHFQGIMKAWTSDLMQSTVLSTILNLCTICFLYTTGDLLFHIDWLKKTNASIQKLVSFLDPCCSALVVFTIGRYRSRRYVTSTQVNKWSISCTFIPVKG